jgi:hypothetical protein
VAAWAISYLATADVPPAGGPPIEPLVSTASTWATAWRRSGSMTSLITGSSSSSGECR